MAASGSLGDFVTCYVVFPFTYVRYAAAAMGGPLLPSAYIATPEFAALLIGATAVVLASTAGAALLAAVERRRPAPRALGFIAADLALILASIVAVESPRSNFQHYLLFLILPVAALSAGCLAVLMTSLAQVSAGRARVVAVLLGAFAAAPLVAMRVAGGDPYLTDRWQPPHERVARDAVKTMLARHVRPGDLMAIWGWMPEYLVSSDAVMGTRDSLSEFQIAQHPFRNYYRARYVRDFDANRPEFFLDAVAPSSAAFVLRSKAGFETFPLLAARIARSYQLLDESGGVRLYRRVER